MKTFLETWLAELPPILHSELSNQARLEPAAQLPLLANALCLRISVEGSASGQLSVAVDREALHRLFVEARLTESSPDGERDAELWRGFLRSLANSTAKAFGDVEVRGIEEATWALGFPAAPYEICLNEMAVPLAFADQVRRKEQPQVAGREVPSNSASTAGNISQGGLDLLLDIELEASLRFGSREMALNEVLELGPGDVVELDRHVSDPVDLLVGDKIVARGEVVLVNGTFGLRVIEVAEPRKCLESIRCLF